MEIEAILTPGQRIRLKADNAAESYSIKTCTSKKLIVCKAVKQPLTIAPDTKHISILKASDSGMFIMDAKLKESSERGSIVALSDIGQPKFMQRRENYRLNHDDISLPFDIELRPQNNVNRYKRLKLHDISAGGLGLILKSSSALVQGMHVNISMNIDRRGAIKAIAEVVHVTSVNLLSKDFLVGLRYVEIDKDSHQLLMSFIQEQVLLKHKGNKADAAVEIEESLCDY